MTRMVCRLQPKKITPTIGMRFATSRTIAEREYAVRRYRPIARPRVSTVMPSAEALVGRQRQELHELVVEHQLVEQLRGLRQPPDARSAERGQLLVADGLVAGGGQRSAVVEMRGRDAPLPELRSRDLGRRRVLHEVV